MPPRVSRNTPCSPNKFQTHHGTPSRSGRPSEVERFRALHLDVDRVAELDEILDGAEMDVGRVVPGCRRISVRGMRPPISSDSRTFQ